MKTGVSAPAVQELVRLSQERFARPRELIQFTADERADKLLNDIERYPHLYVLGCICDFQMKADRAWRVPVALADAAGGPEFDAMAALSQKQINRILQGPPSLHRFPSVIAKRLKGALDRIRASYEGNAALIWSDRPSSAAVMHRFLEFSGAGPKIASMATNILARQFKVPFSDLYSIDVSVDVHLRRVMTRVGIIPPKASWERVIYAARALSPTFPGLIDQVGFELGRSYCRPQKPKCPECPLGQSCPSRALSAR